jgi:hypothetical protein
MVRRASGPCFREQELQFQSVEAVTGRRHEMQSRTIEQAAFQRMPKMSTTMEVSPVTWGVMAW